MARSAVLQDEALDGTMVAVPHLVCNTVCIGIADGAAYACM